MGEAKAKSKTHKAILSGEDRCVYCEEIPSTIEHMPPRTLFRGRSRPNGLVFASCKRCNNETKGADIAAAVFSKISADQDGSYWATLEGQKLIHTLKRDAPGVLDEVFDERRAKREWIPIRGILNDMIVANASSPLLKAYLDVFGAKLAMALFREHVGKPLPAEGMVQTKWFLNRGLSDHNAHAMISIMPLGATLEQGSFKVTDQFAYRYNCDTRSILVALVGLNSNLHFLIMVSSEPEKFKMPYDIFGDGVSGNTCRPGELVDLLPKRIRIPLLQNP